uniref:Uncharacterized protein n=1 Tax=Culex tarsalis TaxID=7177 RepID=A0A1Q3G464_CULTA
MVTPRNESIELAVVKEKHPTASAPPSEEIEKSGSKRSQPRKRCWTVVTLVVVVLVAIGAGTILFYEHLLGWLPAESNGHGPLPEVTEVIRTTSTVPSLVDRGPVIIDPYPDESESRSASTTTEVIFIDSTTDGGSEEKIFIDSKEESVEDSSSEDQTTSDEDHERSSSGDDVTEPRDSDEETSYEEASGSGDGSGDGQE